MKFWKDRWLTDCSLQSHFSLLYELTDNKDSTIAPIVRYNRFYLTFIRSLNNLSQQLHSLYILLSTIILRDLILWRWSTTELFSTNSCYSWLNYGGVKTTRFQVI
jgi:hypothetical protein